MRSPVSLRRSLILASICFVVPASAQSDWVARITEAYRNPAPITTSDVGLTSEAAVEIQRRVVVALKPDFGDVFGYKAGLTSPAARERFGVHEPILGTLLTGMILEDGAEVSASDGVSLLVEADLLVRVKDERINDADTRNAAFDALDLVAPFIEIPDVIIERGQPVSGPVLTAVNSGARWGVAGPPIPVTRLDAADLAEFTVRLEGDGKTMSESSGRALMGHPLDVVLWMVGEAHERGIVFKPGDWLSLGSLTPPVPVRAGQSYTATYQGLGSATLAVRVRVIP